MSDSVTLTFQNGSSLLVDQNPPEKGYIRGLKPPAPMVPVVVLLYLESGERERTRLWRLMTDQQKQFCEELCSAQTRGSTSE